MAEEIKEQKLQTAALERITGLLETANTATGGSNKEEAEERAAQKQERAEANQRRREEARQRIQQIVDNNKLFKMTAQGFKGLQSGFAKFGSRIADGFKSLAAKGKEVAGSAFDILKKVAFVAGLGAILAFLNSPYFVQLKDYVANVVAPALADFYNNALKPAFDNPNEPCYADVCTFSYYWMIQGGCYKVLKGMKYYHRLRNDSYWNACGSNSDRSAKYYHQKIIDL